MRKGKAKYIIVACNGSYRIMLMGKDGLYRKTYEADTIEEAMAQKEALEQADEGEPESKERFLDIPGWK